jgi:hypothetical protein
MPFRRSTVIAIECQTICANLIASLIKKPIIADGRLIYDHEKRYFRVAIG